MCYGGQLHFRDSDCLEGPWLQPEVRLLKVARIKGAIADGSYNVSASELAAKMTAAASKNSGRTLRIL